MLPARDDRAEDRAEERGERVDERVDELVEELVELEDVIELRVGRGCASTSAMSAASSVDRRRGLDLDLGDLNDQVEQLTDLRSMIDLGRGSDQLSAGAGPDRVFARDGLRDQIRTGAGRDLAELDLTDPLSLEIEDILRLPVGDLPNTRIARSRLRWSDPRRVRVPLTCPRANRRGCRGSLRLFALRVDDDGDQRVGRLLGFLRRWRVPGGRTRTVTVPLNRRGRALFRKRRRILVRGVATMRGRFGRKTTIRQIEWIRTGRR